MYVVNHSRIVMMSKDIIAFLVWTQETVYVSVGKQGKKIFLDY